ncbi:EAL domain-containing protein [Bacillus sp. FJAT-29814]|uniref:EAL domain-containing protein n=1 Tax=Bacillus sp. FJAT-29814 TaxID=1729688 RepID=UPI000834E257|nr:EAL domain-containing protein [Bacillus sp. FJAT-29814]
MELSIYNVISNEEFYHVFQPIYDLNTMRIIGFEALLRSSSSLDPTIIFDEAIEVKQLFELDSRSIQKAVRTYLTEGSGIKGKLFLNVYPSTIIHPQFLKFLYNIMLEKENLSQQVNVPFEIVFEISESEDMSDINMQIFKDRIRKIKENGILIAIDDIGKGFVPTQLLVEIEPNFLKLDHYFARDLYRSNRKQFLIKLLIKYCKEYNCYLILEGIENELDLATAQYMGIPYAQGYLIGRPGLLKNRQFT